MYVGALYAQDLYGSLASDQTSKPILVCICVLCSFVYVLVKPLLGSQDMVVQRY